VFNWPPARIFLGDVGSGYLGFMMAATALWSDHLGGPSLLTWLVLLAVFVTDATMTLLRRALRRNRIFEPHREHAYQRAVRAGRSHGAVVRRVLLLNAVLFLAASAIMLGGTLVGAFAVLLAGALLGTAYLAVEREHPMGFGSELAGG
jgi:Fuc2NAc and GlcNAc transferase